MTKTLEKMQKEANRFLLLFQSHCTLFQAATPFIHAQDLTIPPKKERLAIQEN